MQERILRGKQFLLERLMNKEPWPQADVASSNTYGGESRVTVEMGAIISGDFDRRRHSGIHRRLGRERRHRARAVLYFRRDLPGAAGARPDDLSRVEVRLIRALRRTLVYPSRRASCRSAPQGRARNARSKIGR
jgi:hypothetical protein